MSIREIAALIGETAAFAGVIATTLLNVNKVVNGQKCLLRSEMLRIYYHHRDSEEIRQYEYENFVMLYDAYKKLKGNSFIDKIYEEIKEWRVVT